VKTSIHDLTDLLTEWEAWTGSFYQSLACCNHRTCSVRKLLPTEEVFRLRHVHPYFMWLSVWYSLFI